MTEHTGGWAVGARIEWREEQVQLTPQELLLLYGFLRRNRMSWEWVTGMFGTLTHWAKTNNGNCYLTPVFCARAVSYWPSGSIFVLHQS
ncbi:hypothetical protein EVAR_92266_1 [Eumeta japonica]|uniref:Uncharacterized protein n=1 Tax=Eumeta variegata TaxID=151549 RepID=A0A4C1TL94_EUMVA|nr:hypothetical protein EVAR_92266_1 [Eumeta japonica]